MYGGEYFWSELIVVIGILALLTGLVLPAVHKFRESANRVRCAGNLKQIGMAIHLRHQGVGVPPSRQGTIQHRGLMNVLGQIFRRVRFRGLAARVMLRLGRVG